MIPDLIATGFVLFGALCGFVLGVAIIKATEK